MFVSTWFIYSQNSYSPKIESDTNLINELDIKLLIFNPSRSIKIKH